MSDVYIKKRVSRIRNKLMEEDLEALLVTNPVNCRYLSGFTGSAVTLFITLEDAYLITDFRYSQQAEQEAPLFSIISRGSLASALEELCRDKGNQNIGFEQNYMTVYIHDLLRKSYSDLRLVPLFKIVEKLRAVKDIEEISLLRRAAEITQESYKKILSLIKPGMQEREVSIELEYLLKKEGGDKAAFDFIAASGERSSMPHGTASSKIIEPGDLLTLDFGVHYQGYCSDMTRTVAIGYAGEREKELYQLVLRAQMEALSHIRAGITGETADNTARRMITEKELGKNFGHGLGHGLGLEVHEEPRLAPGIKTVLETGMVVTVEPGVYIPGFGGVRIEDTVVIQDNGCDMLTQKYKEDLLIL